MRYNKEKGLYLPEDRFCSLSPGLMPIIGPSGGGGLPSATLTLHFDFSDITTLWQSYDSGNTPPYSTQVNADAQVVEAVNSAFPAPNSELVCVPFGFADASCPVVRISTPGMPLQCLDFDGSNDVYSVFTRAGGTVVVDPFADGYLGLNDKTVIISIRVDTWPGIGVFSRPFVAGSAASEFGIGIVNNAGTHEINLWNYDGSYDFNIHTLATEGFTPDIDMNLVLMFRHNGTNLFSSINGGTEISQASGATGNIGHQIYIGSDKVGSYFNGRIGEIAFWNSCLTGQDLSDALSYFIDKWI